ncbi:MAG TPA: BON domain-containing protein [Polyangia bacterium]|nr:BON domain-containing protein [Polyangia bacterium]
MRRFFGVLAMVAGLASPALAEPNVNPGARTAGAYSTGSTPGTTAADAVTTNVRTVLGADRVLKGSTITVSTSQSGMVTLVGSVPDVTAKTEAVDAAHNVPGVAGVNDQLQILINSPSAPAPR